MKSKTLRPAIAMLELIFALVIMGIVLMSAPMLISTASQSTNVALQQEGINEAASRVHMIMGYAWDENNVDTNYRPPILNVTNGDSAFAKVGTTERRVGIPSESQRTFIRSDTNTTSNLNASPLQSDAGDTDDIDDFIGNISLSLIAETTDDNDLDYVEKTTVNINTDINYSRDSVTGGYNQTAITYVPFSSDTPTTNIKDITVTLTSTDTANADVLEKTIVLRAFSCNIGGYTFEERGF
ncbi:type II secretion system protein [Sulfurovum sp.]|uniref:type II secretion system protein n=1 Tax=Sulfurovum sp. TaxID=1969726 RepID=UPI003562C2E0